MVGVGVNLDTGYLFMEKKRVPVYDPHFKTTAAIT